jgi:hypothetical protein
VLWMSVAGNTLQEDVSYRCWEAVSYRQLVQKDVNYRQSVIGSTPAGRMSVIGSNPAGRMSVIGSIPYRKDVSYWQYATERSVKGSNPGGKMSVIGSTLQEGCQL